MARELRSRTPKQLDAGPEVGKKDESAPPRRSQRARAPKDDGTKLEKPKGEAVNKKTSDKGKQKPTSRGSKLPVKEFWEKRAVKSPPEMSFLPEMTFDFLNLHEPERKFLLGGQPKKDMPWTIQHLLKDLRSTVRSFGVSPEAIAAAPAPPQEPPSARILPFKRQEWEFFLSGADPSHELSPSWLRHQESSVNLARINVQSDYQFAVEVLRTFSDRLRARAFRGPTYLPLVLSGKKEELLEPGELVAAFEKEKHWKAQIEKQPDSQADNSGKPSGHQAKKAKLGTSKTRSSAGLTTGSGADSGAEDAIAEMSLVTIARLAERMDALCDQMEKLRDGHEQYMDIWMDCDRLVRGAEDYLRAELNKEPYDVGVGARTLSKKLLANLKHDRWRGFLGSDPDGDRAYGPEPTEEEEEKGAKKRAHDDGDDCGSDSPVSGYNTDDVAGFDSAISGYGSEDIAGSESTVSGYGTDDIAVYDSDYEGADAKEFLSRQKKKKTMSKSASKPASKPKEEVWHGLGREQAMKKISSMMSKNASKTASSKVIKKASASKKTTTPKDEPWHGLGIDQAMRKISSSHASVASMAGKNKDKNKTAPKFKNVAERDEAGLRTAVEEFREIRERDSGSESEDVEMAD